VVKVTAWVDSIQIGMPPRQLTSRVDYAVLAEVTHQGNVVPTRHSPEPPLPVCFMTTSNFGGNGATNR
jgi:hypothetical protein